MLFSFVWNKEPCAPWCAHEGDEPSRCQVSQVSRYTNLDMLELFVQIYFGASRKAEHNPRLFLNRVKTCGWTSGPGARRNIKPPAFIRAKLVRDVSGFTTKVSPSPWVGSSDSSRVFWSLNYNLLFLLIRVLWSKSQYYAQMWRRSEEGKGGWGGHKNKSPDLWAGVGKQSVIIRKSSNYFI